MGHILQAIQAHYHYLIVEKSDPRLYNLPLMSSPLPILTITAAYVYFITKLGPWMMKDRQPFAMRRLLQVYNLMQIFINLWIWTKFLSLGWMNKYSWYCEPVDYSKSPEAVEMAVYCYKFFLLKILDFVDTVIFVIRKNNRQITFLHVYHHVMMALFMWFGVKYFPGGHGSFIGFINSFVHAVMYSYYLLTSLYPEQKKNMWWKKHITQMQMIQFVVITIHSVQLLFLPDCGFPRYLVVLYIPQLIMLFTLFFNFYKKTYKQSTTSNVEDKSQLKNKSS